MGGRRETEGRKRNGGGKRDGEERREMEKSKMWVEDGGLGKEKRQRRRKKLGEET